LAEAVTNILSTRAMKVRNNIEFLESDRFFSINVQAYQDLGRVVDYLISAYDLLALSY